MNKSYGITGHLSEPITAAVLQYSVTIKIIDKRAPLSLKIFKIIEKVHKRKTLIWRSIRWDWLEIFKYFVAKWIRGHRLRANFVVLKLWNSGRLEMLQHMYNQNLIPPRRGYVLKEWSEMMLSRTRKYIRKKHTDYDA